MKLLVSIFIFVSTLAVAGTADIQYFAAHVEGQSIIVEWKTSVEQNVSRFRLERAGSGDNNFYEAVSVTAKGNNSYYSYTDTHLSAANSNNPPATSAELYRYRLAIIGSDGSVSYSQVISVSRPLSAVRQTWGSIKNMFR